MTTGRFVSFTVSANLSIARSSTTQPESARRSSLSSGTGSV